VKGWIVICSANKDLDVEKKGTIGVTLFFPSKSAAGIGTAHLSTR